MDVRIVHITQNSVLGYENKLFYEFYVLNKTEKLNRIWEFISLILVGKHSLCVHSISVLIYALNFLYHPFQFSLSTNESRNAYLKIDF